MWGVGEVGGGVSQGSPGFCFAYDGVGVHQKSPFDVTLGHILCFCTQSLSPDMSGDGGWSSKALDGEAVAEVQSGLLVKHAGLLQTDGRGVAGRRLNSRTVPSGGGGGSKSEGR